MGTQITIEIKDLEVAGWKCITEEDVYYDYDYDLDEDVESIYSHLIISKGPWEFSSYLSDCFYADCNEWGSNIHRFKEAGLLDIPHILG